MEIIDVFNNDQFQKGTVLKDFRIIKYQTLATIPPRDINSHAIDQKDDVRRTIE